MVGAATVRAQGPGDRLRPHPVLGRLLAKPAGVPTPRPTRWRAPAGTVAAEARLRHGAAEAPALTTRAALEIGAVALTGAGHAAAEALDGHAIFIPAAVVAWGGYTAHRGRREEGHLARLGLTGRDLGPAFRDATLVAAGAGALLAGVAAHRGTLELDADMLPLALLYPVWGVAQQTLVQGYVARNLAGSGGALSSPWLAVPLTALLFGAWHLPDAELAAATTALGLAFTPLYLNHGNTWPLGLWHGLLGVPFYFWILERNPWDELTGG